MATMLEQLRTMTTVVADTGDMNSIHAYTPTDATTNPSLLEAAAKMPEYQSIVDDVLETARAKVGTSASSADVSATAFKTLAVAFGRKILEIVPGRVSTEMDARLSFDREKTIEEARDVIRQYDEAGISRDRVLIKIASTWNGIQAAGVLEKEGIHCDLTLLFGMHQAIACAEAGVTLISPFVGRILDWYKADTGLTYLGADDPGVKSVTDVYYHYKKFGYSTQIMGASFRNIEEIKELAGCDLLTISPKLLSELNATSEDLPRKLNPADAAQSNFEKVTIDEQIFEKMHAEDRMAHEKLTDGIEGFSKALISLEDLLSKRLAELETAAHCLSYLEIHLDQRLLRVAQRRKADRSKLSSRSAGSCQTSTHPAKRRSSAFQPPEVRPIARMPNFHAASASHGASPRATACSARMSIFLSAAAKMSGSGCRFSNYSAHIFLIIWHLFVEGISAISQASREIALASTIPGRGASATQGGF